MPRYAARTDKTAQALVKHARQLGADYMPLNGTLDGILLFRGRVLLIDWKSPGGSLTPDQAKWTARGWPIAYVSTTGQLEALLGLSISPPPYAPCENQTPESHGPCGICKPCFTGAVWAQQPERT